MTRSTKALLLAILVYPGAGHIVLRHYVTGMTFIAVTTISLYFIIDNIFNIASEIVERALHGSVVLDSASLLKAVSQHNLQLLDTLFFLIIVTWLSSIIHLYWLGKSQKKNG